MADEKTAGPMADQRYTAEQYRDEAAIERIAERDTAKLAGTEPNFRLADMLDHAATLATLQSTCDALQAERDEIRQRLSETTPCPCCQWPNAPDAANSWAICACCGFQWQYDERASDYTWDGAWWSKHPIRPQIIDRLTERAERAEAELARLRAYVQHKDECDRNPLGFLSRYGYTFTGLPLPNCTCGLSGLDAPAPVTEACAGPKP